MSSDKELIAAFLEATDDYSLREAAAAIAVSHGTVQRWRSGDWKKLHPETRRAIEGFLADGDTDLPDFFPLVRYAVNREGLRHTARMMQIREGLLRDFIRLKGKVGRDVLMVIREGYQRSGMWLWYDPALVDAATEESAEDAVHDPTEGEEDHEAAQAAEAIADLPRVTRYLRSFDGREDAQMLRLAAVRAWAEIFALQGGYPAWFVALRERVERGEF